MLRDWMPTVGGTIAFVVLSSIGSPLQSAQAAQLQFSFTTESGGTGSFLLNTDTPVAPNPTYIFDSTGQVIAEGKEYLGAISNLLINSPDLGSFQFPGGDFAIFPSYFPTSSPFPAAIAGVPFGCGDDPVGFCAIQVNAFYQGNTAAAMLSDNPQAYEFVTFNRFDEVTGNVVGDRIASQSVVAVPEPSSIAGLVVASGLGARFLRKRRPNPKMTKAQT